MAPLPHSPQAPRPGLARYSRALLLAAPLVLAACGGGSDDPGIAVAPSDFAVDYTPRDIPSTGAHAPVPHATSFLKTRTAPQARCPKCR